MRNLLFLTLVFCMSCQNRSSTAGSAGWEQVTIKVASEFSQKVQDSIPQQYYNKGQLYNYFALRFLKPFSNGETPVVLETSQGGQEWVRLFAVRGDRLRFVTEATGAVTKVESDSLAGIIRLVINNTSSIVLVNCSAG